MSGTHVAFLRGINVGGRHKLPMKDLRGMFEALGCERVRTLIQTGNVVFQASATLAKSVPARIEAAIESQFGFSAPVVSRTAAQLKTAYDDNPLLDEDIDPKFFSIAFLSKKPSAKASAALDPEFVAPDSFELRGRELYLRYPNGQARSKLTNAYIDGQLAVTSTLRNMNTIAKLVDLTRR